MYYEELLMEKGLIDKRYWKESQCKTCDKLFLYRPCEKKGMYCSQICKYNSNQWKDNARKQAEKNKGKHCHSEEWKQILKKRYTGENNPSKRIYVKEKIRKYNLGKIYSEEINNKKGLPKEKNPNWKNGATLRWMMFRSQISSKLRAWSIIVKQRDNWECVKCGSEENVQADHIKPVRYYPKLVLDLNNGQTLCFECHKMKTREMFKNRKEEAIWNVA